MTSLILGILSVPTLGCLGIGAALSIVLGSIALARANREPQVHGGKGLAIGGIAASALSVLVAIPLAGIVAAIAIPSFLRARVSANESATLGDIRTVISAEASYQAANQGYFGTLECLAAPDKCLPGYSGAPFLDSTLAPPTLKSGFLRTFHPGAAVPGPDGALVPERLMSFAYVAVPEKVGQTGVRGFCGDATGRICFTTDGSPPAVTGGRCDPGCTDLR